MENFKYTVFEHVVRGTRFFTNYSPNNNVKELKIVKHTETTEEAQGICDERRSTNLFYFFNTMYDKLDVINNEIINDDGVNSVLEDEYDTRSGGLSDRYKLMIYFAHSTFVIYEKTIISEPTTTVWGFREKNGDVIKRVFDEGISIFNYELSYEQMSRAIEVYLKSKYNPSSVYETEVYKPKK